MPPSRQQGDHALPRHTILSSPQPTAPAARRSRGLRAQNDRVLLGSPTACARGDPLRPEPSSTATRAPGHGRASPPIRSGSATGPTGWPLHARMRLARSPNPPAPRSPVPTDAAAALPASPTLSRNREEALLASIASLRTQVHHRLSQVQTIRSDARATLERLQRAQRTFDALLAAPLSFHSLAVGPPSSGPTGEPSVRSPSPRPRTSR